MVIGTKVVIREREKNVSNVFHIVYGEFVNQVVGVLQQMWATGSITTGLSSGEDTKAHNMEFCT